MTDIQSEGSVQLRIIRGPVGSLSLYEITDYELELLEQGSPSSTYFNFAIFFFSIGASFFTTLVTVKIQSVYVFSIFVVLAVLGTFAALVLFQLWRRTKSRTRNLCEKIRARVPTAPIAGPVDSPQPVGGPTESGG
jgi:hypothetical protein